MIAMYLLLGVIIGLLIGVIGVYIFLNKKHTSQLNSTAEELNLKLTEVSNKFHSSESDVLIKSEQLNLKTSQLISKEEELKSVLNRFELARDELSSWKNKTAVLDEKLSRQKEEIVGLQEKFSKEFRLIANQILDEKTEKRASHLFSDRVTSFEHGANNGAPAK